MSLQVYIMQRYLGLFDSNIHETEEHITTFDALTYKGTMAMLQLHLALSCGACCG